MDLLANQGKLLENQERILARLGEERNDPWRPNHTNTDGVLWTTTDDDGGSRTERMRTQRCTHGCAATLREAGVVDLRTFHDTCVVDRGGDVLLSTSEEEREMTSGADALEREYARALEAGTMPLVRCSVSLTDQRTCTGWNPRVARCMASK